MFKATIIGALIFGAHTRALVARTGQCCFQLKALGAGGAVGTVGQLSDGQNRVYGPLKPATYCIDNGQLTDGNGRGCILTPPTTQFQCDTGASPTPGFSIDCEGGVSINGNSHFYMCPTGDNGEFNIYTKPPPGQSGCVDIVLDASSCYSGCPAPKPAPPPPPPPPPPSPPRTCPTALTVPYEFPHLIIPVNKSSPNTAVGTSYTGIVASDVATLFAFDIPASLKGATCSLIFLLPNKADLKTSSYTLTGSGAIDFAKLSGNPTPATTWNNKPGIATDYGVTTVSPGGSYNIATFDCPAGQQISFEASSTGGTYLDYFQDFNPSAIGCYITTC